MLKRTLLILLCAAMAFTACARTPGETSVNSNQQSPQSNAEEQNGATLAPEETVIPPTPEPTPSSTPFPEAMVEEATDYAFVCNDDCTLFYLPDEESFPVASLAPDDDVLVTGEYEDWFRVKAQDNDGFIKKDSLAHAHGIVIADEVNLREKPDLDADIITKAAINTKVNIISQSDEWFEVQFTEDASKHGYMHFEFIDYPEGYIVKNGVNVRSIPSTSGEIVTQLDMGRTVSILFEYDGWYSISTDEFKGFVRADFVQESPIVLSVEKQRGYINETGVNFRQGPATGFEVISKLYRFSPVYITGETDEWYRVEQEDKTGFVSKEFVEIGKPSVYVTGQDVNLRAAPDTGSDILTKVRQNSEFIIVGQKDNWLKGEVHGNVGYIREDYLDTTPVGDGKVGNEFSDEDIKLAAKVVYLEARDTGYDGYAAVANCLYNRVKSRKFPNSIHDVVYQKNQYTVIHHSRFDTLEPDSTALKATRDVLNGGVRPMPLNVLFFFAKRLGTSWGNDKEFFKVVGDNAFFRYVG